MDAFTCSRIKININTNLNIISIDEITDDLKKLLDSKLVLICEGNSESNIGIVKKRLTNFIDSKKKGNNIKMGLVAEFFIHLYLSTLGFKQECLFLNLEEASMKKGFDGYYSNNSKQWIMESKSCSGTTNKIAHRSKIVEAYTDLKNKLDGKSSNNPWQNAYNHAQLIDVETSKSIRSYIKDMSDDYIKKRYYDIRDFSIIPTSTIYVDSSTFSCVECDLIDSIKKGIKDKDYKDAEIICITKKSMKLFFDYLAIDCEVI